MDDQKRRSEEEQACDSPGPATAPTATASEGRELALVGIGSSAGGLEALKEFFSALPVVTNAAFIVVQHLDPNHPSHMAEILARFTPMRVVEASDGMPVEAGCVYTIPAGQYLQVRDRRLHLAAIVKHNGVRTPIDFLFRSLAAATERAVCVILSGTGSDGTHGLRDVRGAGGMAMAQAPETAEYDAMPRSAIATRLVDHVLAPNAMPEALLAYLGQATTAGIPEASDTEEASLRDVNNIVAFLAARANCDFRHYKRGTIRRRIERRMGLKQFRTIPDYWHFLQENFEEAEALAKDMLISVTSFFREPEAFEALREHALLPLIRERDSETPLRIWVPGCATGEEAYSIAMLVLETLQRENKACRLQIFASDIDSDALQVARAGLYPECVADELSEERLRRFFVEDEQKYRVNKHLRESIIFTVQNVLSDPFFSRVDLVSCRNLLIYLEPEAQKQVLAMFAFALRPGGYLFLGKSDSISGQHAMFETVSRPWRLYRRTDMSPLQIAGFRRLSDNLVSRSPKPRSVESLDPAHLADLNQQALLRLFDAALLLTDPQGEILHFYGPTEKYLAHPTGQASFDLFSMVPADLMPRLRSALHAATEEKRTVRIENVAFPHPSGSLLATVTVLPVMCRKTGRELLAVAFQELPATALAPSQEPLLAEAREESSLVSQLEYELRVTKDNHLAVVEELETANEELRLTNEEVMSTNEEMQSANEELEASKEELQSINEELNTVNSQLTEKIEELTRANNDLANLFSVSDLATIFVDMELGIQRFSPPATKVIHLLPSDLGRPLGHMAHSLLHVDIVAEATQVIQRLGAIEREVQARDGAWYTMRILPYRTLDNRIEGAVLSFADVTRLKLAEAEMQKARLFAESIVKTVREPLLVLDASLHVVSANPSFYRDFPHTAAEIEGQRIDGLPHQPWNTPELRQRLEAIIPTGTPLTDFEVTQAVDSHDVRSFLLNARRIDPPNGQPPLMLLAIEDVSEARRSARQLQLSKNQAEEANRVKGYFLANTSHELRTPMSGILGMLELALGNELPPLVRDYLQTAKDSADVLLVLLNDILDLSRIDAGRLTLEVAPFGLRKMLDETMKMLASRAHEKGLELTCDVPESIPDSLCGDPLRLRQVLVNLIGNAIKFTPSGEVAVRVRRLAHTETETELEFSVADTGIGISPEDQKRIFDRFTQADSATTRQFGGVGLGLAISTSLVQMMGGSLRVDSHLGQGSVFSFTARFSSCAQAPPAAPPPSRLGERMRGLRVLVVDDSATNRRILTAMLATWSMQPEAVGDARTALTKLHTAAEEGRAFPLVVLDGTMPGDDGFALAQWIREDARIRETAILMLSSAGQYRDLRQHEDLHIDDSLDKPVSQAELLRAIGRALGVTTHSESSPTPRAEDRDPGRAERSLRILLAEDTRANQMFVSHVLSTRGHSVEIATDGSMALELLQQREFDVILMDVQMPIMDGFHAAGVIRGLSNRRKSRIPIVALTAHAMKGDADRCLKAGMDAYLPKPINGGELIDIVERIARNRCDESPEG